METRAQSRDTFPLFESEKSCSLSITTQKWEMVAPDGFELPTQGFSGLPSSKPTNPYWYKAQGLKDLQVSLSRPLTLVNAR